MQGFDRFMMREYLQHKILEIIFQTESGSKLSFMGGTCLRIVHGNMRFSEDLDFDNRGVTESGWTALTATIKNELHLFGLTVEIQEVRRQAWHIYIRIPKLLFEEGLTGQEEEKILIQVDAESQLADYPVEVFLLNRWDFLQPIRVVPLPTLMSQKCLAFLNRKREKGRDLFDIAFLTGLGVKPDYAYLAQKTDIKTPEMLLERLKNRTAEVDLKALARDVEPFLIRPADVKKVHLFDQLVENYDWRA
jgi:predicted nucleotidyltransferase component of viral defense system